MKLAFCLFRYFPFGGIQRDFLKIASICAERGHELHLYTLRWDGPDAPFPLQVHFVDVRALRNHSRYEAFAAEVGRMFSDDTYDLVIGFNKMPHLDVYFCGDPCFVHDAHTRRSALYRLGGRYRHFRRFEHAVFSSDAGTEILLLSQAEQSRFQRWHGTPAERFYMLPPFLEADRMQLPDAQQARAALAEELDLNPSHRWAVMIGSSFHTKGVHRAIRSLASLPDEQRDAVQLLVIGRGKTRRFRMLARRLGVASQVHFLGGRDDVPRFLAAADMQLHVSVREKAGVAIVEGIAAGLPIIVTEACGYAHHVASAGAGFVVPEPFDQTQLDVCLARMVSADAAQLRAWREAGRRYAKETDLTSGPRVAADMIEQFARQRSDRSPAHRAGQL